MTKKHNVEHSSIIGGLTGLIVAITLQPLEIIKTNLILNPMRNVSIHSSTFFNSFYLGVREVYNHEGMKGFWRGLSPAILRLIISNSIFFTSLAKFENKFSEYAQDGLYSQTFTNFLSSSLARSLSGILTNPITVIRTRFEVLGFNKYLNMRDAAYQIWKEEGFRGFCRGGMTTILKDAPFAGLYFIIYVRMKRLLERYSDILILNSFVAGLIGGVIATAATNPFDVIRTRLQYRHFQGEHEKIDGILHGFQRIFGQEGLQGLLRGLAPRLVRKPISNASSFVIFEVIHKFVNKKEAF